MDDVAVFLRLLARSATGQKTENYTTISTGPRHPDDIDGPQEYHVVLVDNGRSQMLGGHFREMLRCIRCGACLNHCPVYGAVGGHAYGWVYPGSMGSVLTLLMQGLQLSYDLPNACTLNGRCQSVCPVKIPLADYLRDMRYLQYRSKLGPKAPRVGLNIWRSLGKYPKLFQLANSFGAQMLAWMGGKNNGFTTSLSPWQVAGHKYVTCPLQPEKRLWRNGKNRKSRI